MRNATLVQLADVHVKRGVQCDESECPVALAIIDSLGGDPHAEVEVTWDWIRVEQRHGVFWAETPDEMAKFLPKFDNATEKTRDKLIAAASAGRLQWTLYWQPGDPPGYGDGDE